MVIALILVATGLATVIPPVPQSLANSTHVGGNFVTIPTTALANTVTGAGGSSTAFSAGETRSYQVLGAGSVPSSGVDAVAVDISVVSATGSGFITAYPSGTGRPNTSNLNFNTGATPESNSAMVEVRSDGKISVYVSGTGSTDITIGIEGYVSTSSSGAGGGFVASTPTRVIYTRGTAAPNTPVQPGGYIDINLSGVAGIPSASVAAFVNVTALGATSDGYLRVTVPQSPNSGPAPIARYSADENNATGLVARLDSTKRIRIYNSASADAVDLAVDVQGFFVDVTGGSQGGGFTPLAQRLLDTRNGTAVPANSTLQVSLADQAGLPPWGMAALHS